MDRLELTTANHSRIRGDGRAISVNHAGTYLGCLQVGSDLAPALCAQIEGREVAELTAQLKASIDANTHLKRNTVDRLVREREELKAAARLADDTFINMYEHRIEELKAEIERLREALTDYGEHDSECVRAHWEAGEPTPDGGYRN